ncbi:MAG: purine-nucleoside phosphorylase [Deltaproteobacteria bacterium]|nr:purine-nucleoside phosphorylase [Deltaproteobacteria bacterium]
MSKTIQAAVDLLKGKLTVLPEIGFITGTGLGSLTCKMDMDFRMPYSEIPHFPVSTIDSHRGMLVSGRIAGRSVLAMEGRFHLYEGYTPYEVSLPVRVMSRLGVKYLLISSAAGGLNPGFKPGDLMLVTDHINMTGSNPLTGPNMDGFGPRFPDMSNVYDPVLLDISMKNAIKTGIYLRQGVYIGVLGPSLETPSETRFFRLIGADAIGMSTVHEVITAVHCGIKVIAIVVITNVNRPDLMKKTSIEDVIANAESASHLLSSLWEEIIINLP